MNNKINIYLILFGLVQPPRSKLNQKISFGSVFNFSNPTLKLGCYAKDEYEANLSVETAG